MIGRVRYAGHVFKRDFPLRLRLAQARLFSSVESVATKEKSSKTSKEETQPEEGSQSFIDKYMMLTVRVLVGVGLITGFAQNSKLGRSSLADLDRCEELENKINSVTDTMCTKEWGSDVVNKIKAGDKNALKNSVLTLLDTEKKSAE
jgi:hypothetical protein